MLTAGLAPFEALTTLPGGLALRRAWPRRADHLLLEYARPDGEVVAGQWLADPDRLTQVAEATSRHGAHVECLPEHGVLLQPGGADRRLPALGTLLAEAGATLVVHRPERRAVVHLSQGGRPSLSQQAPAASREEAYAKVVRPDRLAGLVAANATAADGLDGVRTPRLLGVDEAAGVTVWSALAGRSLHDRLGEPDFEDAARRTGLAVRRLHDRPLPPDIRRHDGAAEATVLAQWLGHRAAFFGQDTTVTDRAAAVTHALAGPDRGTADDADRLIPLHRDLHDKQVLLDQEGNVGLLDFDTAAAGEAALDLANLAVHLRWRACQGRCSPAAAEAAVAALLDGYRPEPWVRARLPVYEAAARLRLWCVYAFRPRWAADTAQLVNGSATDQ